MKKNYTQKVLWVARVADNNSDAYKVFPTHVEAEDLAFTYLIHLTPEELKTHIVSVESYIVEIPKDDKRDVGSIYAELVANDDPSVRNPNYYKEIK